MSNWIEQTITKYTGVTDPADVAEIMDVMAGAVRTFGGLSPAVFKREAKAAWGIVSYLKTDAGQAEFAAYMAEAEAA
ncbi:MAG: hypothetical protein WCL10_18855 [Novosphingobium sp.]|uniref:hypothetical protein n=1 Tax=Novosphingobium sp. TaxID=1874826 RepID=UPI003017DA85